LNQAIRILVVEDSEDDARLAMRMLKQGGFDPSYRRVQDVQSLKAAFEHEPWDAVLSDFRLPGFNGVNALAVFRATGLDIPFIFFSGTIGEETAVAAMKAGASDYVMKQHLARLAPALRRELVQARVRAEHRKGQLDLVATRDRFEAQLRDVQKMESIGTLAGGIAHDFNNILGAILGNVALARDDVGPGHPALVSLEEIHKASVRARNLVQQILAFSRHEPQELVTQPLRPVVEETCKLLRATLPARVTLDVRLGEQPLPVLADTTQVQQVLMNLCTNAWQALKDGGGRIVVGLEEAVLDTATSQRLGAVPAGPYAHLWVSDSGVGMDAATRERVFEPFFTTKPVGQGTGLGLSVVHGIVRAHHGAIDVDTAPGQGCTFHLYFPLAALLPAATITAAEAAEATPAAPAVGHGEHVLYVDDDPTMLIMVERILERSGYRVSTCPSALEAIAAVRAQPEAYDCVVTDYNMPDFSGLDFARELARLRPRLPVIISSGYVTPELRDEARLAGVRGLLEKQNTFQDLTRLVGRILAEDAAALH